MAILGDVCRQQAVELPARGLPGPHRVCSLDPVLPSGKDALLRPERPPRAGLPSLLGPVPAPLHPYMCPPERGSAPRTELGPSVLVIKAHGSWVLTSALARMTGTLRDSLRILTFQNSLVGMGGRRNTLRD